MRGDRRAIQGGFTLTELLVVLLLIGIFTGLMIAEMRGTFQDALLRSSARDVMSGLSIAGSRAVSLNQPHLFEWNATDNEFSVRATKTERGSDEAEAVERKRMDERVTIEIRDPSRGLESEAESQSNEPQAPDESQPLRRDVIQFYADGTADAREIALRDNNNGELILRINPVTGRVRVQEDEL